MSDKKEMGKEKKKLQRKSAHGAATKSSDHMHPGCYHGEFARKDKHFEIGLEVRAAAGAGARQSAT